MPCSVRVQRTSAALHRPISTLVAAKEDIPEAVALRLVLPLHLQGTMHGGRPTHGIELLKSTLEPEAPACGSEAGTHCIEHVLLEQVL